VNIEEKILVMQEFSKGTSIEMMVKDLPDGGWCETPHPEWNWVKCQYRIKPNPAYLYAKPANGGYELSKSHYTDEEIKRGSQWGNFTGWIKLINTEDKCLKKY